MRLIHVDTKRLTEFASRPPPYAVLSHTWSNSEVTYDDMLTGNGTEKLGWRKIEETCRQAREDGLRYAWVDTCCINKDSSAELSESINSMFRWYREAAICYAFLEDVRRAASIGQDVLQLWPNFQSARWFSRGWTLQELLAPAKEFRFYGEDWQLIGTREELAMVISQATNIDRDAIYSWSSEEYIRHASIARKMSWAANRETTREEDTAYSLLGLFDVNMPLLYGEGGSRAFERLQEEMMKRGTDHSFLVWGDAWDARTSMSNNIHFLARHPRQFSGCGSIMKSGEQVAPFALNNLGLQMRLPVYRVSGWKADFVAILACYDEREVLTHRRRIGIPLTSTERSATEFLFTFYEGLVAVDEAQYRAARVRDCCILRTRKDSGREQLLWLRNSEKLSIKTILYINNDGMWKKHTGDREMIRLNERIYRDEKTSTFAITVTPKHGIDAFHVFVRVDIERRYSAKVSVRDINQKWHRDFAISELPMDNIKSIAASRFEALRLDDKRYNPLCASLTWERILERDVLVLDVDVGTRHAQLMSIVMPALATGLGALLMQLVLVGIVTTIMSYHDPLYLTPANPIARMLLLFHAYRLRNSSSIALPTIVQSGRQLACYSALAAAVQNSFITQWTLMAYSLYQCWHLRKFLRLILTLLALAVAVFVALSTEHRVSSWVHVCLTTAQELFWIILESELMLG